MYLGKQIAYLRGLKNIPRKEMEDKLGISLQQYTNYENDKSHINPERLAQIAKVLGVEATAISHLDLLQVMDQLNNHVPVADKPNDTPTTAAVEEEIIETINTLMSTLNKFKSVLAKALFSRGGVIYRMNNSKTWMLANFRVQPALR